MKTTLFEYLSTIDDLYKLNEIFNNKIHKLIGYGNHSFVFEYDSNKVIKIKNNNNKKYNDYGFYKTYKIDYFIFNDNVLTIDNKHLSVFNNKLYYVIMEKLKTPKDLINSIDILEFIIKDFVIDIKIPSLLWLYNNLYDDELLKDLIIYAKMNLNINEYNFLIDILSKILPLFIYMKKNNIIWYDIHKNNFGYNKNGDLVPFDMEY